MVDAGKHVDTSIFEAHSIRSASTSAAYTLGVTTEDILGAVDWSKASSFQQFITNLCAKQHLLYQSYQLQTTPLICETEPSEV